MATKDKQGPDECAICLGPLSSGTVCTPPCTHTFHVACVEGLRSFDLKQGRPLCRAELRPGPEKLITDCGGMSAIFCRGAPPPGSIGFCAIWDCISLSSSSQALFVCAVLSMVPH